MSELTIEKLKDKNEYLRKRFQEVDLILGKMILVMQAAVIESEHGGGDKEAMEWIINTLVGPGEFAPEDEKDAQAYFDREMVKVDEELGKLYDYFNSRYKKLCAEGIKTMSTEQVREEFEVWLISTGESADSQNGIYLSPIANIGWEAWQASRAALVVELPSLSDIQCQYCADDVLEKVVESLRVAGITVKGA